MDFYQFCENRGKVQKNPAIPGKGKKCVKLQRHIVFGVKCALFFAGLGPHYQGARYEQLFRFLKNVRIHV